MSGPTTVKDVREAIAQLIESAGLGLWESTYTAASSWPIYFRKMPDGATVPDAVIVITPYGIGGAHAQGVQVRVRGPKSSTTDAEDRATAIKVALHGAGPVTRGSTDMALITCTSGPVTLRTDSLGREELSLNLRVVTDDPNDSLDY